MFFANHKGREFIFVGKLRSVEVLEDNWLLQTRLSFEARGSIDHVI